jgi:hypothetical protein
MVENYDDTFKLSASFDEDLYDDSKNHNDKEDIKNDETKLVNKDGHNGSKDPSDQTIINNNVNKNDYNEYFHYNNFSIQDNSNKQNLYNYYQNEINDLNKYRNSSSNENYILGEGDLLQNNFQNYIEQMENKKTSNTSVNTVQVNGKQINTSNEAISNVLNDMFHTTEINLDNKKDMQFLRKKKDRRTKKEVDEEKRMKSKEIKVKKKLGRKKLDKETEINLKSEHTKFHDDNIIKKINSYFLEYCRNWLNNSFLNEKNEFEAQKTRKRLKKNIFLKISPKIITTNLKKETVMSVMKKKLKDLFSNQISVKYRNYTNDQNEIFIKQIYKDNNQPFVIFILNLTFIELFNYFNGQSNGDNFRKYFLDRNIDPNLVEQFLNNFNKIETFLLTIKNKEKLSQELVQDYVQRISLLCLNYEESFKNKFNRSKNKKK